MPDGNDKLTATFARTTIGGFYTAKLTTRTNKAETRVFAVNVDPAEGDLKALNGADLTSPPRAGPEIQVRLRLPDSRPSSTRPRPQPRHVLLIVLVVVLVLEQLLAWSCGYHVSAPAAVRRQAPVFGSAKGGLA